MKRKIYHPDWFLLLLVLTLFTVGLTALYSAGGQERFETQLERGIIGIALMLCIGFLPLRWLKHGGFIFFLASVAMLVLVLFFGVKINNARRWLNIGFYIQPSELVKVLLPLGLAYFYAQFSERRWWHHLLALLIVVVPVLLVLRQPDFGTAALIAIAGAATIFFAGISWLWIGGFTVLGASLLPLLWHGLKPYQQKRIETMLDPYQDPLGAGYHTIQSEIAVGSGGIWGKGFQSGTQAQLGFLPERHTDFIFAVYAEEFGLAGTCFLLALFVLIAWRCLYVAARTGNIFGQCAVAGIVAVFFLTSVINMSMVSGLLPIVGMPLPLVSYGGTALLSAFIGFGVVISVYRHQQRTVAR